MHTTTVPVDWDNLVSMYTLHSYNPDTHELVEKKEAKIARLENELKTNKVRVDANKHVLESTAILLKELEKESKKIEKELKEMKDTK